VPPTPTCFAIKLPSSGSLSKTKVCRSNKNFSIKNCPTRCNTKQSIYYSVSSLYMFRVSTTTIIRSTQNCNYSLRYWSHFCAAASLQRGQTSVSGCTAYSLYTLIWDTSHDSAGRYSFGSYMDMDVCVDSPGSIHCCDYVTEEGSSPCGVVTAAMCAHNCCVYCGLLTFQDS